MTLKEKYELIDMQVIEEYISNAQEENLHLEFKTIRHSTFRADDDKSNFAKCLSAFANSEGGIVIWGIIAKKNDDEIDCAIDKAFIDNLQLFLSRLNELTTEALSPYLAGVIHTPIEFSTNCGFVKTYIPEGDQGPYMAKLKEYRYYQRIGNRNQKMEHFQIADLFGRRKRPNLSLYYILSNRGKKLHTDIHRFYLDLFILNKGKGTAKAPYVNIYSKEQFSFVDLNNNLDIIDMMEYSSNKFDIKFGNDPNIVIHPKTSIRVVKLTIEIPIDFINKNEEDIKIFYEVTAEDMVLKEDEIIITKKEIRDVFLGF